MNKYIAEMIGTFALVLLGCGSAVVSGVSLAWGGASGGPAGIGLLGIAVAFGVSVVVMAYSIGNISGCHINPAITVSMLVAKKITVTDAIGYIVGQMIGAVIASAVLLTILKGMPGYEMPEWALGANGWGPGYGHEYNTGTAFLAEMILTFLFLFVIFATTSKLGNSNMAGLAIGLTLVIINLVAIPITGASVNPARSFGPAILSGGKALQQLWLFIVAPCVGGILAAVVWMGIFEPKKSTT